MIKTLQRNPTQLEGIFKVYMTQKIFPALLKGLLKYRRMAFLFLKYLFLF